MKQIILYPLYFNSLVSRKKGRRIPLKYSIKNPKAEEIHRIALSLGFKSKIEGKHHPSRWFKREGRIVIETDLKKTELISIIGKRLLNARKENR